MKVTSQRKLPTPSWRGLCRFIGERPTHSEYLTPRALSTVGSSPISKPVRTGSLRCVRACARACVHAYVRTVHHTTQDCMSLLLYVGVCHGSCYLPSLLTWIGFCQAEYGTVCHEYISSKDIKMGVRRTHVHFYQPLPPSLRVATLAGSCILGELSVRLNPPLPPPLPAVVWSPSLYCLVRRYKLARSPNVTHQLLTSTIATFEDFARYGHISLVTKAQYPGSLRALFEV